MKIKIENLKYITKFEKYFQILEKRTNMRLNEQNNKEIYNFIRNNIYSHKIEKNKLIKRNSTSQIKKYINGKISIDDLKKKIQYYKKINYERKSVDSLHVKNNKIINSVYLNKNYIYKLRKSNIEQQNIQNSIKENFAKTIYNDKAKIDLKEIYNINNKQNNEKIKRLSISSYSDNKENKSIKLYKKSNNKINTKSSDKIFFQKIKKNVQNIAKKNKNKIYNKINNAYNSKIVLDSFPMHYATIIEYKPHNIKENIKENHSKYDFRTADNLILVSYPKINKYYKIKPKSYSFSVYKNRNIRYSSFNMN